LQACKTGSPQSALSSGRQTPGIRVFGTESLRKNAD
jgi:hypothetical protein